jgi:predicted benzoate:H+ symporter BenE
MQFSPLLLRHMMVCAICILVGVMALARACWSRVPVCNEWGRAVQSTARDSGALT